MFEEMTQDSILFRRERESISFDEVNLRNIENKFGTPTYLFSADQIRRNIRFLREKMLKHNPRTKIAYSVKIISYQKFVLLLQTK